MQVPKNESGVPLKWKNHFPLKFVTSPPSGTGLTRKPKQTLLKDRFNNLLGSFDTEREAAEAADQFRANPDSLLPLVGGKPNG